MTRKEAIAQAVKTHDLKEISKIVNFMRIGPVRHTYADTLEVFMRCSPGLTEADFEALMYEVDNFESGVTPAKEEGRFPR